MNSAKTILATLTVGLVFLVVGCAQKFPILSVEINNDWEKSSFQKPNLNPLHFHIINSEEVPHRFTKTSDYYKIIATVNPSGHSQNLNIEFIAQGENGRSLSLKGVWNGPPIYMSNEFPTTTFVQDLVTQADSYLFTWEPAFSGEHYNRDGRSVGHFMTVSFSHEMEDYKKEAEIVNGQTISLKIYDGDVLVGEETVHLRVWLNGYAKYYVVP